LISVLCTSEVNPNTYGATLAVHGAGGFGKTTAVIGMCYDTSLQQHFADGVIFVELGPKASDPCIKLRNLYHLLTGQYLKCSDVNLIEQEVMQLTSNYCRSLLVIIDDVWHAKDVEPLIRAFSHSKIIVTSRMNDIEKIIPVKQTISVGPMNFNEAILLLTYGIARSEDLSEEDKSLLDVVCQYVHFWPLLLSLVRGHLGHSLKLYRSMSYHEAMKRTIAKLKEKGLTALDKNDRNRRYAVTACIDITLELLTDNLSNKLKSLILLTGVGTSVQEILVQILWDCSEDEAKDTIENLWSYGLVRCFEILIPINKIKQQYIEVHNVISQYITEKLEFKEVLKLSPFGYSSFAKKAATCIHEQCDHANLVLSATDYLLHELSALENIWLPFYLKMINRYAINDPHYVISILETVRFGITITEIRKLLYRSFIEQIDSLINESRQLLKNVHNLNTQVMKKCEHYLFIKNYTSLVNLIEDHCTISPIGLVVKKSVNMLAKLCEDKTLTNIVMLCKEMQIMLPEYHFISTHIVPYIKLFVKLHEQICTSLQNGSPDVELTHYYIICGKFKKDLRSVIQKRYHKLQGINPEYVSRQKLIFKAE